jgi:hypothetical protein
MADNKLATARMKVRIAARDLAVADAYTPRGDERDKKIRKATEVLDKKILACAALLNGGES